MNTRDKTYLVDFRIISKEPSDDLHKAAIKGFLEDFYRAFSMRYSKGSWDYIPRDFNTKHTFEEYFNKMRGIYAYLENLGFNVNSESTRWMGDNNLAVHNWSSEIPPEGKGMDVGFFFKVGLIIKYDGDDEDSYDDKINHVMHSEVISKLKEAVGNYIRQCFIDEADTFGEFDVALASIKAPSALFSKFGGKRSFIKAYAKKASCPAIRIQPNLFDQ